MAEIEQSTKVQTVEAVSLESELKKVPTLAAFTREALASLGTVDLVHAEPGEELFSATNKLRGFWALLKGEVHVFRREDDGTFSFFGSMAEGETFGEGPLLLGKKPQSIAKIFQPSTLVYFSEEVFWKLMDRCPQVRREVLENMSKRFKLYQSQALHREKLVALGTLTAGLMHELNNPGAAARRAASQLRENLNRLQVISLRLCSGDQKTSKQVECLRGLQEQALLPRKPVSMNAIERSDAEERLAEWLEEQGIENAWKLAPTLMEFNIDACALACATHEFPGQTLSDPLNWLAALISSTQLVSTIEESVSRVTDLVRAVKRYAYEDKKQQHELDIQEGLESTLIILGHKLREKELEVRKEFAVDLPRISTCGIGLNQVWTNLLDNAIDAAPNKTAITLRTSLRGTPDGPQIAVAIVDHGPGIPEEYRKQIFEPFFTTKPAGEGTGLGLDIVQRIVMDQFHGRLELDSVPGKTEFTVVLPVSFCELPS